MRRRRFAPLAAFAFVCLTLVAQEQIVEHGAQPDKKHVEFVLTPTDAVPRPGGFGFATAKVRNIDSARRRVEVRIKTKWTPTPTYFASRRVDLEPGATATLRLPVAYTNDVLTFEVVVDGRVLDPDVFAARVASRGAGVYETGGPSVLLVADSPRDADALHKRFLDDLDDASVPLHRDSFTHLFPRAAADDLPEDWTMLSRNDAIVVDCRAASLDGARQRALVDFARAGGARVALHVEESRLPSGPLDDLVRSLEPSSGNERSRPVGAGRLHAFVAKTTPTAAAARALSYLHALPGDRAFSGAPLDGFFARLEVPGLGEVPVRAFLVFILGYLVFIGVMARRFAKARKPAKLLVYLPLCGVAATLVILAFGVFSEGLGVKGALRSFSILDQRDRAVASFSSRSLYAAFEPSRLPLPEGTTLYSVDLLHDRRDAAHRFDIRYEAGRALDGAILPARRPTDFVTTTVETARDRLRFKRRPDGGLDCLAEASLRPRGDLPLIAREKSGKAWLVRRGDGPLQEVPEAEARAAVDALVDAFAAFKTAPDEARFVAAGYAAKVNGLVAKARTGSHVATPDDATSQNRLRTYVRSEALRVLNDGGWFGAIERRPEFVPSLGLDPDYGAELHLVAGLLSEDDVGL
jgi:hypothetical protein